MTLPYRDILLFLPMAISLLMGAANNAFRAGHPATPNYDGAALGGMFGALSFLIAIHLIFFERRRPRRYARAWPRYLVAIVLWIGGMCAAAWNLASAAPRLHP